MEGELLNTGLRGDWLGTQTETELSDSARQEPPGWTRRSEAVQLLRYSTGTWKVPLRARMWVRSSCTPVDPEEHVYRECWARHSWLWLHSRPQPPAARTADLLQLLLPRTGGIEGALGGCTRSPAVRALAPRWWGQGTASNVGQHSTLTYHLQRQHPTLESQFKSQLFYSGGGKTSHSFSLSL